MDPRLQKMADVLVNYSVRVRPGDWVVIQSAIAGEPLVQACVEAILKAGGNPTTLLASEDVSETQYRVANDEQLGFISPLTRLVVEQADVSISILAPTNTRGLAEVDPRRLGVSQKAFGPLMNTYLERATRGELRWTMCAYPTPAAAQDAGMSLRAYEEFVYSAGMLDRDDPVTAWRELSERQQKLIDWLQEKKTIHIAGPGTDLTVGIEGRTWINDVGHENFPGGEIFTGPLEDATEGTIQFSFPAFLRGREVSGVRLKFEAGKVVDAAATGDEAFLFEMLDTDEGARRLGEFAFGTNPGIQRFTKNVLFDEKIGGTLHMALGRSYEETGGTNQSSLHWDMVQGLHRDTEVRVDGELFSKDGVFQV